MAVSVIETYAVNQPIFSRCSVDFLIADFFGDSGSVIASLKHLFVSDTSLNSNLHLVEKRAFSTPRRSEDQDVLPFRVHNLLILDRIRKLAVQKNGFEEIEHAVKLQ